MNAVILHRPAATGRQCTCAWTRPRTCARPSRRNHGTIRSESAGSTQPGAREEARDHREHRQRRVDRAGDRLLRLRGQALAAEAAARLPLEVPDDAACRTSRRSSGADRGRSARRALPRRARRRRARACRRRAAGTRRRSSGRAPGRGGRGPPPRRRGAAGARTARNAAPPSITLSRPKASSARLPVRTASKRARPPSPKTWRKVSPRSQCMRRRRARLSSARHRAGRGGRVQMAGHAGILCSRAPGRPKGNRMPPSRLCER